MKKNAIMYNAAVGVTLEVGLFIEVTGLGDFVDDG